MARFVRLNDDYTVNAEFVVRIAVMRDEDGDRTLHVYMSDTSELVVGEVGPPIDIDAVRAALEGAS
jgi:hypothetical protein